MDYVQYDCNIDGTWFKFQDMFGSETIPIVIEELNNNSYGIKDIQLKPNDILVDVGANIGIISIYMVKKFGCKAICFEPIDTNIENFKTNILLNDLNPSDFEIHQKAVTDKDDDILKIGKSKYNTGGCTIFYNENYEVIDVETTTLNKYITPDVKYLKIDCEGGEHDLIPNIKHNLGNLKYIGIELHKLSEVHDLVSLYNQIRETFKGDIFIDVWDQFTEDKKFSTTQMMRDLDINYKNNN